jgi:hypothetical protein
LHALNEPQNPGSSYAYGCIPRQSGRKHCIPLFEEAQNRHCQQHDGSLANLDAGIE